MANATATMQAEPSANMTAVSSRNEEEAQLEAVLDQINETGGRVAESLGRIHRLMQDIVGEMRTAHGAGPKGN